MTRLLLQARDFQSQDDHAISQAAKRETVIGAAALRGLRAINDNVDMNELSRRTLRFDATAVAGLLGAPRVVDALRASYQPIAETFLDAAQDEAEEVFGPLVVYDPLVAAAELAGARQSFMGSVLNQAAQVVADVLVNAARTGADPAEVAAALSQVIGLTPRQAAAVSNFRRLLMDGDREALRRALRDRRFDATVESWISGGNTVDEAKVDAMVARYAERSLASRAATIARTESLKAVVNGIRDAYKQAVDSGRLLDSEVRRRWLVVPDERLCPVCGSIPLLNDIHGVGVNEPYKSINGLIIAPLAHPNCRCTEVYTADLSRISVQPFRLAA